MTVIERLFQYMRHHRLTPYQFERGCNIANGYLKKQQKGKGTIGSEILEKISEKYKDLNIAWLITGQGRMLSEHFYVSEEQQSNLLESTPGYASNEQTTRMLREKIAILEHALADKEKIIRLLEEKNQRGAEA